MMLRDFGSYVNICVCLSTDAPRIFVLSTEMKVLTNRRNCSFENLT